MKIKRKWHALNVKNLDSNVIERLLFHAETAAYGSILGRIWLNGKLRDWCCMPGELLPITAEEQAAADSLLLT